MNVQTNTIKIPLSSTSGLSKVFPIVLAKVFTAPSLEKGCLIRLEIASPGSNCSMNSTVLEVFFRSPNPHSKYPLKIPSPINQTTIVPTANAAIDLWDFLVSKNIEPCGLGARDTLRLEAGMHLYGQDLDETTTPYEAGLGWLVNLENNHEFFGRDFLEKQSRIGIKKKLVGLTIEGRAIGRKGCEVFKDGKNIGTITSGSWSPTKQKAIAFAYIQNSYATLNNVVEILIRGKTFKGTITKRAFYKKDI